MEQTFWKELGAFLAEYLDIPADWYWPDGAIRQKAAAVCIKTLIEESVFTAEELRNTAAREYQIIILHDLFPSKQ